MKPLVVMDPVSAAMGVALDCGVSLADFWKMSSWDLLQVVRANLRRMRKQKKDGLFFAWYNALWRGGAKGVPTLSVLCDRIDGDAAAGGIPTREEFGNKIKSMFGYPGDA